MTKPNDTAEATEPEWLDRVRRHAEEIQAHPAAERFAQACLFMVGQWCELHRALNVQRVVLDECRNERNRLRAENFQLKEKIKALHHWECMCDVCAEQKP